MTGDLLTNRPNHEELLKFYGHSVPEPAEATVAEVEHVIDHLLAIGVGENGDGIIVVRCGSQGACVATRAGGKRWIPAYLDKSPQRVKDVTGGEWGNKVLHKPPLTT